jgi:hypothetical protein
MKNHPLMCHMLQLYEFETPSVSPLVTAEQHADDKRQLPTGIPCLHVFHTFKQSRQSDVYVE